jgi:hypothetical protein
MVHFYQKCMPSHFLTPHLFYFCIVDILVFKKMKNNKKQLKLSSVCTVHEVSSWYFKYSKRKKVKARWHGGVNRMAGWWKRNGTMVKTWWNDGEKAMVQWLKHDGAMVWWWKRDGTMVKTRCNIAFPPSSYRTIAISPSYHCVFTIVPSRFHHRTIVHLGYRLNKKSRLSNRVSLIRQGFNMKYHGNLELWPQTSM